jgi:periplasmic protein TonB
LLMIVSVFALALAAAAPDKPEPLIQEGDYPAEALKRGEQGAVRFLLTVALNGRVRACEIVASSGSRSLAETTCRLVAKRARFAPARDAGGKPVEGKYPGRINWVLPTVTAPAPNAK